KENSIRHSYSVNAVWHQAKRCLGKCTRRWRHFSSTWRLFNRSGRILTKPSVLVDADRKSTRLNSSHGSISYAVFCLKKKMKRQSSCPLIRKASIGALPEIHTCIQ